MQIDMARFRDTFFAEAADHLAAMEASLLRLEGLDDGDSFDDIFRAIHSIKGGSATFGLADIARFAHGFETVLDRLRQGEIELGGDLLELLLQANDLLRELVTSAKTGAPPSDKLDPTLAAFERFVGVPG